MAATPPKGQLTLQVAPPVPSPSTHTTLLGLSIPVFAPTTLPPVTVAAALACRPFQDWASALDPRYSIASITLQSVDFFGPRVGFVKFIADASWCGQRVPGIVFLRGGAVSVLPLLVCSGERWVVCARQPRLAVGSGSFLELPAGMLDDCGSFVGVAAKELVEETGIVIDPSELMDLTALALGTGGDCGASGGEGVGARRGLYLSVGACDEFLRLFFFQRTVGKEELDALRGKLTGSPDENEQITLELVRYEDLWKATVDAKTLASVFLLEKLIKMGKITLFE